MQPPALLLTLAVWRVRLVWQTRVLSQSSFFIGGVFLGAGLLHMLPDASAALSSHFSFPLVFLCSALGFLLVWVLDKLNFAERQLDNSALVSMAARSSAATLCYVSLKPVILSYGSLRNNSQLVIKQAQDTARQLVQQQGAAVGGEQGGDWLQALRLKSAAGAEDEAAVDETTPIAVYPAVTVIRVPEEAKQPEGQREVEGSEGEKEGPSEREPRQTQRAAASSASFARLLNGDEQRDGRAHSASAYAHRRAAASSAASERLLPPAAPSSPAVCSEDAAAEGEESGHEHEELHHHHISIPQHALLPVFLALVFSVHSLIEGLALGAQTAVGGSAVSLLVAIASHKLIEAVSVSANFMKQSVAPHTALPVLLVYTLMTPLGIAAGWAVDSAMRGGEEAGEARAQDDPAGPISWSLLFQSLLQAFAAGSFVYLAVHEISDEKCCAQVRRWQQILLMMTGLSVMAALAVVA